MSCSDDKQSLASFTDLLSEFKSVKSLVRLPIPSKVDKNQSQTNRILSNTPIPSCDNYLAVQQKCKVVEQTFKNLSATSNQSSGTFFKNQNEEGIGIKTTDSVLNSKQYILPKSNILRPEVVSKLKLALCPPVNETVPGLQPINVIHKNSPTVKQPADGSLIVSRTLNAVEGTLSRHALAAGAVTTEVAVSSASSVAKQQNHHCVMVHTSDSTLQKDLCLNQSNYPKEAPVVNVHQNSRLNTVSNPNLIESVKTTNRKQIVSNMTKLIKDITTQSTGLPEPLMPVWNKPSEYVPTSTTISSTPETTETSDLQTSLPIWTKPSQYNQESINNVVNENTSQASSCMINSSGDKPTTVENQPTENTDEMQCSLYSCDPIGLDNLQKKPEKQSEEPAECEKRKPSAHYKQVRYLRTIVQIGNENETVPSEAPIKSDFVSASVEKKSLPDVLQLGRKGTVETNATKDSGITKVYQEIHMNPVSAIPIKSAPPSYMISKLPNVKPPKNSPIYGSPKNVIRISVKSKTSASVPALRNVQIAPHIQTPVSVSKQNSNLNTQPIAPQIPSSIRIPVQNLSEPPLSDLNSKGSKNSEKVDTLHIGPFLPMIPTTVNMICQPNVQSLTPNNNSIVSHTNVYITNVEKQNESLRIKSQKLLHSSRSSEKNQGRKKVKSTVNTRMDSIVQAVFQSSGITRVSKISQTTQNTSNCHLSSTNQTNNVKDNVTKTSNTRELKISTSADCKEILVIEDDPRVRSQNSSQMKPDASLQPVKHVSEQNITCKFFSNQNLVTEKNTTALCKLAPKKISLNSKELNKLVPGILSPRESNANGKELHNHEGCFPEGTVRKKLLKTYSRNKQNIVGKKIQLEPEAKLTKEHINDYFPVVSQGTTQDSSVLTKVKQENVATLMLTSQENEDLEVVYEKFNFCAENMKTSNIMKKGSKVKNVYCRGVSHSDLEALRKTETRVVLHKLSFPGTEIETNNSLATSELILEMPESLKLDNCEVNEFPDGVFEQGEAETEHSSGAKNSLDLCKIKIEMPETVDIDNNQGNEFSYSEVEQPNYNQDKAKTSCSMSATEIDSKQSLDICKIKIEMPETVNRDKHEGGEIIVNTVLNCSNFKVKMETNQQAITDIATKNSLSKTNLGKAKSVVNENHQKNAFPDVEHPSYNENQNETYRSPAATDLDLKNTLVTPETNLEMKRNKQKHLSKALVLGNSSTEGAVEMVTPETNLETKRNKQKHLSKALVLGNSGTEGAVENYGFRENKSFVCKENVEVSETDSSSDEIELTSNRNCNSSVESDSSESMDMSMVIGKDRKLGRQMKRWRIENYSTSNQNPSISDERSSTVESDSSSNEDDSADESNSNLSESSASSEGKHFTSSSSSTSYQAGRKESDRRLICLAHGDRKKSEIVNLRKSHKCKPKETVVEKIDPYLSFLIKPCFVKLEKLDEPCICESVKDYKVAMQNPIFKGKKYSSQMKYVLSRLESSFKRKQKRNEKYRQKVWKMVSHFYKKMKKEERRELTKDDRQLCYDLESLGFLYGSKTKDQQSTAKERKEKYVKKMQKMVSYFLKKMSKKKVRNMNKMTNDYTNQWIPYRKAKNPSSSRTTKTHQKQYSTFHNTEANTQSMTHDRGAKRKRPVSDLSSSSEDESQFHCAQSGISLRKNNTLANTRSNGYDRVVKRKGLVYAESSSSTENDAHSHYTHRKLARKKTSMTKRKSLASIASSLEEENCALFETLANTRSNGYDRVVKRKGLVYAESSSSTENDTHLPYNRRKLSTKKTSMSIASSSKEENCALSETYPVISAKKPQVCSLESSSSIEPQVPLRKTELMNFASCNTQQSSGISFGSQFGTQKTQPRKKYNSLEEKLADLEKRLEETTKLLNIRSRHS